MKGGGHGLCCSRINAITMATKFLLVWLIWCLAGLQHSSSSSATPTNSNNTAFSSLDIDFKTFLSQPLKNNVNIGTTPFNIHLHRPRRLFLVYKGFLSPRQHSISAWFFLVPTCSYWLMTPQLNYDFNYYSVRRNRDIQVSLKCFTSKHICSFSIKRSEVGLFHGQVAA